MASVSGYLRANVLGLVAIFLALNAGAYAVTTTDDGTADKTVFNQDLANSSVDSRVLAAGAVTGPDIQAAAVGPKKLKLDKLVKYLQTRVNAQCPDGQSVQGILADGGVLCAVDDVNPGTITGVTTSGGLTGGGTSGTVNVGVDPAQIQSRVTGTCSGIQMLQSINQNGGVGCQAIPTDGASGTPTLRSLGTGAAQAAAGNDPRLSDTRTPTDGSVTAAKFAALPHGKVRQTGTCQAIANDGAFHQVQFDDQQFGSDVTFDDASDTLTVNTSGTYQVGAYVNWTQSGNGSRGLEVLTTGPTHELAYDGREGSSVVNTGQTASGLVSLTAGTSLIVTAGQNSGPGSLAFVDPFGDQGCANLSVQWVGP